MRLSSRMEIPEMEAKLGTVETRANSALALAIILIGAQLVVAVFLLKIWLNARPSRQPHDAVRGLELDDVPRGVPADTRARRPRAPPTASPIGPTPAQAHGRPVPAYVRAEARGENEDYFNPASSRVGRWPARQPTWTAGSGLGVQTHGADYTEQRRSGRFSSDNPRTNTNNADYGRKGSKFAHGT
ncbi:hypothetical protein UCDDA912_g05952 [Diaporthe ampelina]|uniref:Uncharacterized protein n=1 Tax=Diaporthe ampelina TaxID=1214573 RepID=A0A0G2I1V4_9PEZI|nr:hypothetical protein UCDDA912_g05952 [Diaporthe ampelina]